MFNIIPSLNNVVLAENLNSTIDFYLTILVKDVILNQENLIYLIKETKGKILNSDLVITSSFFVESIEILNNLNDEDENFINFHIRPARRVNFNQCDLLGYDVNLILRKNCYLKIINERFDDYEYNINKINSHIVDLNLNI